MGICSYFRHSVEKIITLLNHLKVRPIIFKLSRFNRRVLKVLVFHNLKSLQTTPTKIESYFAPLEFSFSRLNESGPCKVYQVCYCQILKLIDPALADKF